MRHWNEEQYGFSAGLQVEFLPYLWGIETITPRTSLPPVHDFYPTYEALKRRTVWLLSRIASRIFTLPMRHWNYHAPHFLAARPWFLPYLWGIETIQFSILEGLLVLIFTLPMRHWNNYGFPKLWLLLEKFLPYLWGIETYILHLNIDFCIKFLPYLWGIETLKGSFRIIRL